MSVRSDRIMRYLNETGHVKGLRARLRDRLPDPDALECERMLDAALERAIELASDPEAWPAGKQRARTA